MPTALAAGTSLVLFLILWVLLLKTSWASFPLGRALSALLIASAYVALALLPPERAFASISLPTLALLTGCMLLSAHAERQGLYRALSALLLRGGGGRLSFLARVSFFSAAASALVTNDAACILLPPLVLAACRARSYSPRPYLIAIATAANIGSACSAVGNPQNMVIAAASGLSFRAFLAAIALPSLLGLAVNGAVIAAVWRAELWGGAAAAAAGAAAASAAAASAACPEPEREGEHQRLRAPGSAASSQPPDAAPAPDAGCGAAALAVAPAAAAPGSPLQPPPPLPPQPLEDLPPPNRAVQCVLAALPLALLFADHWMGLPWTVLLGGALCCALERADPAPALARIDAKLLLFFAGLFVCVEGLSASELPRALLEGVVVGSSGSAQSLLAFTLAVLVGSNTVSNVPLVLLMAPMLPAGSSQWLVLAWASTVAGNLTLLGSVANIIVAEVAAKEGVELSFLEYAYVGVPSTLLNLVLFTPLVNAIAVRL